jgi:hypothetical protein
MKVVPELDALRFVGIRAYRRVRTREEQSLLARVVPANHVRRTATFAMDFQDLAVPFRLAQVVALDHEVVANFCSHGSAPFLGHPVLSSVEPGDALLIDVRSVRGWRARAKGLLAYPALPNSAPSA